MERISPHRLAHIDSIRAIAALMVVTIHSSAAVVPVRPVAMHAGQVFDWLVQNLDFGRIGVVLFFVISGFVIPASLREGTRRGEFWVRRVLRLYPAYWVSIALAALVHWQIAGSAWSPRVLLANATMLQSLLHVGDLEGVYWTLKLELAFYAGCYLLHRLGLLALVLDEIAHLANLAGWDALGRSTPLLLAACVLLSLPVSALLFWTVERPAMQLGRRWSRG